MATPLTKIIILLLCINTVLFLNGVRVIDDTGNSFLSKFVNEDAYSEGQLVANEETGGIGVSVSDDLAKSGTEILSFVDALAAVKAFVTFLINIILTPVGLFVSGGLPQTVGLMVGVPMMVLAVFGVAYFLRSGN